jgi:hypothetical protein
MSWGHTGRVTRVYWDRPDPAGRRIRRAAVGKEGTALLFAGLSASMLATVVRIAAPAGSIRK